MPDGTTGQAINSGNSTVVSGAGSAGTPDAGVVSVQGVASGTVLPTKDASDMSGTTPGTAPSNTGVVGGIYNSSAPSPSSGQTLPIQLDSAGRVIVNVGAGSSGNAAAGPTGSAVPADADYIGFNVSGNLTGVSSSNPLPVTVAGGGSNAAAGLIASTPPTSGSNTAFVDAALVTLVDVNYFQPFPVIDYVGTYADGIAAPYGFASFLGSWSVGGVSNATISNGNTLSVIAGQTILVGLQSGAGSSESALTLTDNLGNTYIQAKAVTWTAESLVIELWYCVSQYSGNLKTTATYTNSSGPGGMGVAIYNGILALDHTNGGIGNSTSPSSGTVTVSGNDVLIGFLAGVSAITPAAGFTTRGGVEGFSPFVDKLVSTNTAITGTMTSGQWAGIGASFTVTNSPFGIPALGKNSSGILHALSLDANGYLNVNVDTATLGTVTVTGTVAATQSGNWTTRIVGNAGATLDQAPGSAIPTNGLMVGGTDGTNFRAFLTDTSGQQKILVENSTLAVTQSGTWTVGISAAQTIAATQSGTWTTVTAPDSSTGNAPSAVTVGVSSGLALASNSSRKGLVLVNTSANTISIAFGANAAVLNSGITLYQGGSYNMDAYSFTTAAINAIASAASSNLAIQEYQ